jgi:hypothetical protein
MPLKGKICGMDTDGSASILSIHPEGLAEDNKKTFASPIINPNSSAYVPNYLVPKCGVRFGFGNKLLTFGG